MKIDYEKLFQTYGIDYISSGDEHCTEGWLSLPCPFCSPDKYHLGVNLDSGKFHCWACGGHSSWRVLSVVLKQSQEQVQKTVSRFILGTEGRVHRVSYENSLDKPVNFPAGTTALQVNHKDYIRSRGYKPKQMVDLYKIKATPRYTRLGPRIIMPIYWQGIPVSWTARLINNKGPRYLKCPKSQESFPAKNTLYGWEYIRDKCVVVEGIFDMWRLGPGAVATMGLGYSPEQVELLSHLNQVFIMFDSDKPARVRSVNLAKRLSALVDVEIIEIDAEDPDSLSNEEARQIMGELGF